MSGLKRQFGSGGMHGSYVSPTGSVSQRRTFVRDNFVFARTTTFCVANVGFLHVVAGNFWCNAPREENNEGEVLPAAQEKSEKVLRPWPVWRKPNAIIGMCSIASNRSDQSEVLFWTREPWTS